MKKILFAVSLFSVLFLTGCFASDRAKEKAVISGAAEYLNEKYGFEPEYDSLEWLKATSTVGISIPKKTGDIILEFLDESGSEISVYYDNEDDSFKDSYQHEEINNAIQQVLYPILDNIENLHIGRDGQYSDIDFEEFYYNSYFDGDISSFMENEDISIYSDDVFYITCDSKNEAEIINGSLEKQFEIFHGYRSMEFVYISDDRFSRYSGGKCNKPNTGMTECWLKVTYNNDNVSITENDFVKLTDKIYIESASGGYVMNEGDVKISGEISAEEFNRIAEEDHEAFIKKNNKAREAQKVKGDIECIQAVSDTPVYIIEFSDEAKKHMDNYGCINVYFCSDEENMLYRYRSDTDHPTSVATAYDEYSDPRLMNLSDGDYIWCGSFSYK